MVRTLAVVQACVGSPQFHSNLGRRLGGQSLLGWVVRRVTDCTKIDRVIVLAHGPRGGSRIAGLVPSDVPVFVSDEPDATARFVAALDRHPAQAVVRVRGDNPFIDPGLIDRLVTTAAEHAGYDYISYHSRNGRPAVLSPIGICAEWISVRSLREAARLNRHDREHVTRYIYSHPELFHIRLIPAPAELDRDDVRLTVDHEEDWENALTIFEALGPERLEWQRIADLLDHQPALRRRMADLNRACAAG